VASKIGDPDVERQASSTKMRRKAVNPRANIIVALHTYNSVAFNILETHLPSRLHRVALPKPVSSSSPLPFSLDLLRTGWSYTDSSKPGRGKRGRIEATARVLDGESIY
jgi:hypothetical protein